MWLNQKVVKPKYGYAKNLSSVLSVNRVWSVWAYMEVKQTLFSVIVTRLFGSQMVLYLVPVRVLILHHMKLLTHHRVFLTYMFDINVVALLFTANLYFCLYCFSFRLENHFC